MSGRVLLVVAAVLAYGTAAKAHLPVWQDGLSLWRHASQRLLAKMISELAWEGAFELDSGDVEDLINKAARVPGVGSGTPLVSVSRGGVRGS